MTEYDPGYFDYAASNPPLEQALGAQNEAARRFPANPSALHSAAAAARAFWQEQSHRLAGLCGCRNGYWIATSGGTEANNLVIQSVLEQFPRGRVLIAADSHASVWRCANRTPDRVDVLPLVPDGAISAAALHAALTPATVLVSLMHGSNESGLVQPVADLAAACAERRVRLHLDGAQTLGHLPVDFARLGCNYFTFSAHKFGGPRGFGGVLARAPDLHPLFFGGDQQDGIRPGTENLPGLAGTVAALETSIARQTLEIPRLRGLAGELLTRLQRVLPDLRCNADPSTGLPGLLSLSFKGLDAAALVTDLDLQGFAIATGSACHAQRREPSRAILALGRSAEEALGTVRISMGAGTTAAAVAGLAEALCQAVQRQRVRT